MDLTLNIKVYHTKKLLEVNLHDVRKKYKPNFTKNRNPFF